jgi:hypothetical protein
MGIFDGYFDAGNYQSPQGSLIDRLLAQLQTQSVYQPGNAGFPAVPGQNNAQAPAPQNPIAVGNYMMPRIGNGFAAPVVAQDDDEPVAGIRPGAALPRQNSAERDAGVLPGQLPPQIRNEGGFGAGVRGFVDNMHNGLLGAVVGGVESGLGMQSPQQQLLQAQYSALIQSGLSPAKALLAITNPEAAKSIMPAQFGNDNFSVSQTGEDGMGRKTFEVFNKRTGEHQPINSGASNTSGALGDPNLTGDAYLASLPPEQAKVVKAMVEGRRQPVSQYALKLPYWKSMLEAAQTYDPTFDETKWSGRLAGVKDFSSGKSSEMVRAANQTLHHVGQLLNSMDDLKNGPYPLINKAGNFISEELGSGEQGAFRTNAHAVAEELSKVFKGSNLSDAEIRTWESNLNEDMSPTQQRAQIAKLRDLLQGSLQALDEKRVNSMGQIAADKAGPIIKPEGEKVLARINSWLAGNKAGDQLTTKTGVKWSVE